VNASILVTADPRPRARSRGPQRVVRRNRTPGRKVAVVSDFSLTGEAVRAALRDRGFTVLGAAVPSRAVEVRDLRRQFRGFAPNVALLLQERLDPRHLSGALRTISEFHELRWLLLTGSEEEPRWGAGLAAGAAAVLPMTIGLQDLADSLSRLCAGEELMPPVEKDRLVRLWTDHSAEQRLLVTRLELLTPREMQVLRHLQIGRSVAEIAESGGVAVGTVRSQVKSILRKLEVTSQLAAVAALQQAEERLPGPDGS
jgi:two-component system nitrate/nitrite response regulator NarL